MLGHTLHYCQVGGCCLGKVMLDQYSTFMSPNSRFTNTLISVLILTDLLTSVCCGWAAKMTKIWSIAQFRRRWPAIPLVLAAQLRCYQHSIRVPHLSHIVSQYFMADPAEMRQWVEWAAHSRVSPFESLSHDKPQELQAVLILHSTEKFICC